MSSGRYVVVPNMNSKRLEHELLNNHRDRIISIADIDESFEIINDMKSCNDLHWMDIHRYLFETILGLKKRGCDMSNLINYFNSKTRELYKYEG